MVRWISFIEYITGTGVDIKFEHIEDSNNEDTDALSRLIHYVTTMSYLPDDQEELFQLIEASVDETKDARTLIKSQLASTICSIIPALIGG